MIITKSVKELAEHCLVIQNDIISATDEMEKAVLADNQLFHELMQSYVRQACYDLLRGLVRTERGNIWNAPNAGQATSGSLNTAVAGTVTRLMDLRVPSGKRLGDCSKDEVAEAAYFYYKQAENMAHKYHWFQAIEKGLPENKIVRQVFTEAALDNLRSAAETVVQI